MKANNNLNNHIHEPDVELSPPQSNGTYIAVGTTDDTYTNAINCSTPPVVAEELMLYRSKCHIDDIPVVARGMTWNDPFYDVNDHTGSTPTEIIAAFDIDRTLYDRPTFEIFSWFILILMLSFMWLPMLLLPGTLGLFFITSLIVGIVFACIYAAVDCQRCEKRSRMKCMHIAITTHGIYIDAVDVPGSYDLQHRNTIKYDEIVKCQVNSYFNYYDRSMTYQIVINTKDDFIIRNELGVVFFGPYPKYTIEGLRKQQKFVDIVNAMMKCNTCDTKASAVDTAGVETRDPYVIDKVL